MTLRYVEYETVEVKVEGCADVLVINKHDFDPKIHTLVEAKAQKKEEPKEPKLKKYQKNELSTMTVDKLKELPHWEKVEAADKASFTKSQIIDAILEVQS